MRPTWDETWLGVAYVVARRSRCTRAQIGAVIVNTEQRIISTGYNGPPSGFMVNGSMCDKFCSRATAEILDPGYNDCPSIHAEMNALMYADRSRYEAGTLYVTSSCCFPCGKAIANSGIARVVMAMNGDADAHRSPERTISFMRTCGLHVDIQ